MSDEQLGKAYYQYTNRGWPNPTPWENQTTGSRDLWILRAKYAAKRDKG